MAACFSDLENLDIRTREDRRDIAAADKMDEMLVNSAPVDANVVGQLVDRFLAG
jgi:hypothetical protein